MEQHQRYLQVISPFQSIPILATELVWLETIGHPGSMSLKIKVRESLDSAMWLGAKLTIIIRAKDQPVRELCAYVLSLTQAQTDIMGYQSYELNLGSWLSLLDQASGCQTFVNQTVVQMSKSALEFSPYSFIDDSLLTSELKPISYAARFNESALDFVSRQLHQSGLFYWLDYQKDRQVMRLGDSIQSYGTVKTPLVWPNRNLNNRHDHLIEASVIQGAVTKQFKQYHYNGEQDQQERTVYGFDDKNRSGEFCQYGPVSAKQIAYSQCHVPTWVRFSCRHSALSVAKTMQLLGDIPEILQQHASLFIVEVKHVVRDTTGIEHEYDQVPTQSYHNDVKAIPWQPHPYYPEIKAKKPNVASVQNAFIVGPKKNERYCDELMRVKVWFPWDEHNTKMDYQLCPWVRVKVPFAHQNRGAQFIPCVGDEVAVMYLDDDVDQPYVVSSLYNEVNQPPFRYDKDRSVSGIKAPGGHALYFSDLDDKEQFVVSSSGDIENTVLAHESQRIEMHKNVSVKGDVVVSVEKGAYLLKAEKEIQLQVAGSCIKLDPNTIELTSANISLSVQGDKSIAQLAAIGSMHSCPKVVSDQPHVGGSITTGSSNVFINGKPAARVGDLAVCHGATDQLSQGHSHLLINGKPAVSVNFATAHGGRVTKGEAGVVSCEKPITPGVINNVDLVVPPVQLSFSMCNGTNGDDAKIRGHFCTLVNPKGKALQFLLDTDDFKAKAYHLMPGTYSCQLAPHVRTLEIIGVNGKPMLPSYKADIAIDGPGKFDFDVLWPLMMIDLREGEYGKNPAMMLSEQDIQYFKNNGNNVMVFIHGFNVPLGKMAKEISGVKTLAQAANEMHAQDDFVDPKAMMAMDIANDELADSGKNLIFERSDYSSSVFRDEEMIAYQVKHDIPKGTFMSDENGDTGLNGTGAFCWALCMEKNLNTTAQNTLSVDPEYFQKFNRCLHITWSGNPKSPLDYMNAVPRGLQAGKKLADIISLLKSHGLTVNVIAHSLGNSVLLSCMNRLGEKAEHKIDHAFYWEAAIPQNAFFRPKPPVDAPWYEKQWYQPHAKIAANKVTILHSKNDNVIGAIPNDNASRGLSQNEINRSKPFWVELIPALILTYMEFESLYHLATWFGVPASHLLSCAVQQEVYRHLLQSKNARIVPKTAGSEEQQRLVDQGYVMPELLDQIKLNEKRDNAFYHELYQRAKSIQPKINTALKGAGWGRAEHLSVLENKAAIYMAEGIVNHAEDFCLAMGLALKMINPETRELEDIIDVELGRFMPIVKGIGCLIKTMEALGHDVWPAMGRVGLGEDIGKLKKFAIVRDVEQTNQLWSHSGMKHPSERVKTIYKHDIMGANGIKQFGGVNA